MYLGQWIQAPAHEMATLNNVLGRCMSEIEHLGHMYTVTVLTVDQALYYKLMQLKWLVPECRFKLIPRLGGLHISLYKGDRETL